MKLWLSKNRTVPIQQQLRTQLMLGIISGDLAAGSKLPSTPEIARRFRVHANTVRAVYRELVKGQWAEWRQGSGFYVRNRTAELAGGDELDRLISMFVELAEQSGYTPDDIRARILDRTTANPPDHILVLEPDPALRAILVAELQTSTGVPAEGIGIDAQVAAGRLDRALPVVLPDHQDAARAVLPALTTLVTLQSRSIAASLIGQSRPSADVPITVISAWPDFARWAQVILTGVGLDPQAFDVRDTGSAGWNRGLTARSFVVTDTLTAGALPRGCKPRVFAIVSDQSIAELRRRFDPARGYTATP